MKSLVVLVLVGIFASGCASVLVNRSLQRENPLVVKAADGGTVLVGADLFSLKTVQDHPWISLGAAILDAGATYWAVDSAKHYLRDDSSGGQQATYDAENVYVIDTSGSGNEVYINSNQGNTAQ